MISLLFLVMINVWHLPQPVTQITMDTHDTTKMGMVCHRSGIPATVPIPVKPVGHLPWVYPYPCYTLVVSQITLSLLFTCSANDEMGLSKDDPSLLIGNLSCVGLNVTHDANDSLLSILAVHWNLR